jgi:hypothetical protein
MPILSPDIVPLAEDIEARVIGKLDGIDSMRLVGPRSRHMRAKAEALVLKCAAEVRVLQSRAYLCT